MKAAIIVFPGSNCDRDIKVAINRVGGKAEFVWYKDANLDGYDLIVLPGGFSYGDIEGAGKLASQSDIMKEIAKKNSQGVKVLGICNGFQILVTSGLLPGSLILNEKSRFICKNVELHPVNNNSYFTRSYLKYIKVIMPVAHHTGKYDISYEEYKKLTDKDQIAFTYADNPNGSSYNIAGVFNWNKTILGMMPHPERAYEDESGCFGGLPLFKSLLG